MRRHRVEFSPEAIAQAQQIARWWRENRPAAPDLFDDEVGSMTVPFRDFSYVLKVQCDEDPGITGVRDMAILQKLQQSDEVTFGEDGEVEGWLTDPYDPSERGPVTRNKSELEAYDPVFPQHPLSLARAILRHLKEAVRIADEIRSAPPFLFPPGGPGSIR